LNPFYGYFYGAYNIFFINCARNVEKIHTKISNFWFHQGWKNNVIPDKNAYKSHISVYTGRSKLGYWYKHNYSFQEATKNENGSEEDDFSSLTNEYDQKNNPYDLSLIRKTKQIKCAKPSFSNPKSKCSDDLDFTGMSENMNLEEVDKVAGEIIHTMETDKFKVLTYLV
jgi:hypothetical protein